MKRKDVKCLSFIYQCGMDIPTMSSFLRPILTVTSVWNTEETGDINM